MARKCRELGGDPLAINETEDHVHVLARFPSTLSIAQLVKEMKGASSHLVNHAIRPEAPFKWQGGYGAFTISQHEVPRLTAYIRNQKRHHADGTINQDAERTWKDEIPGEGFRKG